MSCAGSAGWSRGSVYHAAKCSAGPPGQSFVHGLRGAPYVKGWSDLGWSALERVGASRLPWATDAAGPAARLCPAGRASGPAARQVQDARPVILQRDCMNYVTGCRCRWEPRPGARSPRPGGLFTVSIPAFRVCRGRDSAELIPGRPIDLAADQI